MVRSCCVVTLRCMLLLEMEMRTSWSYTWRPGAADGVVDHVRAVRPATPTARKPGGRERRGTSRGGVASIYNIDQAWHARVCISCLLPAGCVHRMRRAAVCARISCTHSCSSSGQDNAMRVARTEKDSLRCDHRQTADMRTPVDAPVGRQTPCLCCWSTRGAAEKVHHVQCANQKANA
jgi:hypothetical protein